LREQASVDCLKEIEISGDYLIRTFYTNPDLLPTKTSLIARSDVRNLILGAWIYCR